MPYGVTGSISRQISKNTLTLIGWCAHIWFHTCEHGGRRGNDKSAHATSDEGTLSIECGHSTSES